MIRVRFRRKEEIWEQADNFRLSEKLKDHNIPPIDIIYIAEVILKLDVIPFPGLFSDYKMDAALLPDLSGIYIDEEAYSEWEGSDHWAEKRLRFSFAHELGHYIMHSNEIRANRFSSLEEFKQWAGDRSHYSSAEYQADEFAGRFLVPRELLLSHYDRYCKKAQDYDPNWREIEGMREHIAKKLSPIFGVNRQVIETRLDREDIWSAE